MSRNTSIEFNRGNEQEIYGAHRPVMRKRLVLLAGLLLAWNTCQVLAQTAKNHFKFVNVVDSTRGYSGFSQFPAINNCGSIAFIANRRDGQGVIKSQDHRSLQDGRSGIAIASLHKGSKEDCESER